MIGAVVPWVRAWRHAEAACQDHRYLHIGAMLLYTSLPVVAASAYYFKATWIFGGALTGLFSLTLSDLNQDTALRFISVYLFQTPDWLYELGFRQSIETKDDGSCFFDAVSRALDKPQNEVRQAIADWIDALEPESDEWAQYQNQSKGALDYSWCIRQGDLKTWGDALEAIAISKIYSVCVNVHYRGGIHRYGEGDKVIDLFYTASAAGGSNNHYRLLKRFIF